MSAGVTLYQKHFSHRDFISPKHFFYGHNSARQHLYRHQYVGTRYSTIFIHRFLDQRLLSSAPIPVFRNGTHRHGAGCTFLYLTLADLRDFQKDSFSDRNSYEATKDATCSIAERMGSFFLRSL